MELRHLRYFIAVADELHFSRAAERLHIAQPPLSQQIRDLEEELGVRLFDRSKRRVALTTAGQAFLEEALQALQHVDKAVKAAQRASRGDIGRLIVGLNSSATYSVLPRILRVFREHCSDVELVLHELTTSQQLESLHHSKIDMGLLYLPVDSDDLCFLSVLKEPLLIAIPDTHPLTSQPQVSIHALGRDPFILPAPNLGSGLYSKIVSFFQQTSFAPAVEQEANRLQTIISLVAGGIGVALVPASLENLHTRGVAYKPLQELTPEIEIALTWRRNDTSPILQKFLNSVRETGLKQL